VDFFFLKFSVLSFAKQADSMEKPLKKLVELIGACVRIGTQRPRDLRHILGITHFAATQIQDPDADVRCFTVMDWQEIFPEPFSLKFHSFPGVGASISLVEGAALVALMKSVQAKRVFEFGTYKGVSTTQMAMNLSPDGLIYTLDLPEEGSAKAALRISKESERAIADETGKGSLIPKEFLSQIVFLKEDSACFHPEPFEETMDLVFVDGAHSLDYVRNDTEKGWRMLRNGGVIAWHDCTPSHRDVVHYLHSFPQRIRLVGGTTLAFAYKGTASHRS
jgi:predicted O-methyltransferase YrrM